MLAFVNNGKFKAVAVGNIDEDQDFDVWTIDENRNLLNINNDLNNTKEVYD